MHPYPIKISYLEYGEQLGNENHKHQSERFLKQLEELNWIKVLNKASVHPVFMELKNL